MGTTLTAGTLVAGDTLLVGHVGDSRAYLLHDGELRQVTDDHSLVEELVREGRLTADEAAVHPQRSIITRALGVDASVEVDVYPVELAPGDRLLLCSDGLTGMVHADDIAADAATRERPDARARPARRRRQRGRRRGQHHRGGRRGHRRGAAARAPGADRADRGHGSRPSTTHTGPGERRRRGLRGVGRVLLWALPIVLVLGIAVAAVGWYAREGLLRGREPGSGDGVQGRARRPRGLEPDHRAAHRRSTSPTCDPAAQAAGARAPDVLVACRRRRVRQAAAGPDHHDDHHHDEHDHHRTADDHRAADHAPRPRPPRREVAHRAAGVAAASSASGSSRSW